MDDNTHAGGDVANPLTDSQLELLHDLLTRLRQDRKQELANQPLPSVDMQQVHDHSEESVNSQSAEIASGLRHHAATEITLIDAALARMAAGSYGTCIDCGEQIGLERLQAYPIARRCIACKQVYEEGL